MRIAALLLCIVATLPLCASEAPAWTEDFDAALKAAQESDPKGRVLVLIRDTADVASLDCAKLLRATSEFNELLANTQRVMLWRGHALGEAFKPPVVSALILCDAEGKPLAAERIPDFRDKLKPTLEKLLAVTEAKEPPSLPSGGIDGLIAKLPTDTGALAKLMMQELKDTAKTKERAEALLKIDLPRDASACALLGFVIFEKQFDDLKPALLEKVKREAPRGRLAADLFLDFADEATAAGKHEDAAELWEAALAASDGESPVLRQAAAVALWSASGVDGSAPSPYLKRTARDVVVLVHDLPSYFEAIARWSDDDFFPVLFADDVYARKFVEAYKPETIVEIPRAENPTTAISIGEVRHVLIESWRSSDPKPMQQRSEIDFEHELKKHQRAPRGIVIWDGFAPELAGAVALAAGRFQPLEVLEPFKISEAKTLDVHDSAKAPAVRAFAARVQDRSKHWGVRSQGWTYVTLAGAYPFRYQDIPNAIDKNTNYCVDDWVGRDEDGVRVAVTGRLIGDRARSAYQAMCSLFLQPENVLLFNTYGLDPKSIWGAYRMDFSAAAFGDHFEMKHIKGNDANVRNFHRATLPWNNHGLVLINSSGGTQDWSVGGGGGSSDDMLVGGPVAIHMTHSNSAGNPYDASTIAGRALQGGAYFYFGSMSEPYLTSFQPPSYYAPRIAAGTPLAAAFRKRAGQMFSQPWRLMIVGDPQFSLRARPMKREKYDLRDDEKTVSLAQFAGSAAKYEGLLRKWPPQETVAAWKRADSSERTLPFVRLYTRQALIQLFDKALDAEDSVAARELLPDLLATQPVNRFAERSIESITNLLQKKESNDAALAWLKKQAEEAQPENYRVLFTQRIKKIEEAKK